MKSHLEPENHVADFSITQLSPSEGVAFKPDVDKSEQITGKPYMQAQRKFQNSLLENKGNKP